MVNDDPETLRERVQWFLATDSGAVVYVREVLSTVGVVCLVGLLLFAVSGLWPPMVAVTSGSMEPNLHRGDLVFVVEEHRFAPDRAHAETGVVPARTGAETGYRTFGAPGDVIVYQPRGDATGTPIIHRARFWVNESENWVANGKADPAYLGGARSCGELSQCPAPHAGFITKGDNPTTNDRYDQVMGLSPVVRPAWVVGTAEFRIPWLGNIRLWADDQILTAATDPTRGGTAAARDATPDTPRRCGWSHEQCRSTLLNDRISIFNIYT
ncbi:S26 family signal peptidase [Haloglomus litoreum]|uniref:S26 family signal peptidase n=1 Tax=Haloglomus litoreum TaxID=3034026 RepID=UPI0023E8759B|nr:S26 family signal peptidase [Haloglomus sp. DT116]